MRLDLQENGRPKPTVAAEVALPVELVELKALRTRAGEPVRVLCEAISELAAAEALECLPGLAPPSTAQEQEDAMSSVRRLMSVGPPLIEAGTCLLAEDGSEIRPAFYFREPRPGALPGRLLRLEDLALLVNAIMRLSGYGGGAAGAGFPDEGRAGDGSGLGTVAAGAGDGDAAAPAAGS